MARYEDIAETVRLDEVLDSLGVYVERIRNGNHWGDCPLHDDQNSHFSINEDTLLWNCYVCNEGGRLPKLVMLALSLDSDEFQSAWQKAVEWLIPFSDSDIADDSDYEEHQKRLARARKKIEDSATDKVKRRAEMPVFSERVLAKLEDVPQKHLNKWSINTETAKAFRIGYDSKRKRGEYVAPALVIPHFFRGKLVGYQERWLAADRPKWVPKYTNSEDFPKSETLYNYDAAVENGGVVIVVESVMSVLRLWELGYNAVSPFGASINKEQIRLLRGFDNGVILSYDNDEAGKKGLKKAIKGLAGEVPVKKLPFIAGENSDIADLSDREIHDLIDRAKTVFRASTTPKW